jgi:hypothetical protein
MTFFEACEIRHRAKVMKDDPPAASMITARQSSETTDPTVDSQIIQLQVAGCDGLITIVTPTPSNIRR